MHKGNIEKANALSAQISKDITRQNKTRLGKLNIFNSKTRPKALWSVVRQLTGAKCDTAQHISTALLLILSTPTTPVSPLTHNTRNLHTNLPVLLLTSLFQNSLSSTYLINSLQPLLVLIPFPLGFSDSLHPSSVNL